MFLAASHQVSPPPQKNHHQLKIITTTEIASPWVAKKNIHMVWRDPSLVSNPGNSPCCSVFIFLVIWCIQHQSVLGETWLSWWKICLAVARTSATDPWWLVGPWWWTLDKRLDSSKENAVSRRFVKMSKLRNFYGKALFSIFILFKSSPILILRIINWFICDYRHVL